MRNATPILVLVLLALPAVAAEGVTVAVLDTGIDASHSEFTRSVMRESFTGPSLPGIGALDQPFVLDPDGRGTGVASLVAGATLGASTNTTLWDLQVVSPETGTPLDPRTEAAAEQAMDYILARDEKPNVVLISFAEDGVTGAGGATLGAQAGQLWDAGVLVVVPTASSSSPLHSDPRVLTVGGSSTCSGGGNDEATGMKPDLVAPDTTVEVADPNPPIGQGGTRGVGGTAYAAAQVAGVAAAMLELNPELPVDAVAAILRSTATGAEDGPQGCVGWGVLDRVAALAAAAAWSDPVSEPAPNQSIPGPAGLFVIVFLVGAASWRRAWS